MKRKRRKINTYANTHSAAVITDELKKKNFNIRKCIECFFFCNINTKYIQRTYTSAEPRAIRTFSERV